MSTCVQQSAFLFIDILCLREVLDVLLEGLIVTAGLLNKLSILRSAFLQVFYFFMELEERTQLRHFSNFVPYFLCLLFLLEICLFSIGLARHRI